MRCLRYSTLASITFALVLSACVGEEPPHLLYAEDPQSLENPFPDARLFGESGYAFRQDWYAPFVLPKALNGSLRALLGRWAEAGPDVRGVGIFGPTLLRVSEPVDPASLSGVASRLRKVAGGYEVLEANVHVEHARAQLVGSPHPQDTDFPEYLMVRPAVPLPEKDEGLLVIRRGLKTVSGEPLGRGFAYDRMPETSERVRLAAAALGIAEADILLTLPQVATDLTSDLKALAAWSTARTPGFTVPPKALVAAGPTHRPVGLWRAGEADFATLSKWLEKRSYLRPASQVGAVAIGTFKAKDLRDDRGLWTPAAVAAPEAAREVDLGFVLTVPAGPKPAGGWPVIIGQHGINGRNLPYLNSGDAFCLEVAQLLATAGYACLGVDATSHGERGNPFDFFALNDIAVAREHFRQMLVDHLQLSRLAQVLDFDGDGAADLSQQVSFFGNSLGAIMGASATSLDPRLTVGVLNVPGGGLTNILVSRDLRDRIGLLLIAEVGLGFESPEYFSVFPLFRAAAQLILEGADPVNLAQASSGRPLLVQEGMGDLTIPNFTTQQLSRALGLQTATAPQAGGSALRVHFQVDPARYVPGVNVEKYNGHNVFWDAAAIRRQAMRFFTSGGTELTVE